MTRQEILTELQKLFAEELDYDGEVTEETTKDDVDEWEPNPRGAGVLFGQKLVDKFNQWQISQKI